MEVRPSIDVYPEDCRFVINTNIFAYFYENYLIVNIWNIYETNVEDIRDCPDILRQLIFFTKF